MNCNSTFFKVFWTLLAYGWLAEAQVTQINGQANSTEDGLCGDATYRVTICFPGTPQNATCTYSVQSGSTPGEEVPIADQQECPKGLLFQNPCTQITGVVTIAFGPCTVDTVPAPQLQNNTLDVAAWIDVLGLRKVEAMGALQIRGYAYQTRYPLQGANLFPSLTYFQQLPPSFNANPLNAQLSLSGMEVPAFPKLRNVPSGISILNSPDHSLDNPVRFPALEGFQNGLSIAGCNSLASLEGLEGLKMGMNVTSIQIINNLIMSNFTALADLFGCRPDGSTGLNASMPIGIVAAHPIPLQPIDHGCTLQAPGTLCAYIADSTQCPDGTEYVRNNDGTIERIRRTPSGALSPGPGLAPALASVPAGSPLPGNFDVRVG